MSIPSMLKDRKAFIALGALVISVMIVIIASMVLFNSLYLFFKLDNGEERLSGDYTYLSSGIYDGLWLADHGFINAGAVYVLIDTLNNVDTGVNVAVWGYKHASDGSFSIQARCNNRTITVTYANSTILSWD